MFRERSQTTDAVAKPASSSFSRKAHVATHDVRVVFSIPFERESLYSPHSLWDVFQLAWAVLQALGMAQLVKAMISDGTVATKIPGKERTIHA